MEEYGKWKWDDIQDLEQPYAKTDLFNLFCVSF